MLSFVQWLEVIHLLWYDYCKGKIGVRYIGIARSVPYPGVGIILENDIFIYYESLAWGIFNLITI